MEDFQHAPHLVFSDERHPKVGGEAFCVQPRRVVFNAMLQTVRDLHQSALAHGHGCIARIQARRLRTGGSIVEAATRHIFQGARLRIRHEDVRRIHLQLAHDTIKDDREHPVQIQPTCDRDVHFMQGFHISEPALCVGEEACIHNCLCCLCCDAL